MSEKSTERQEMVQRIRAEFPPDQQLVLAFDDCRIGVRTNSLALTNTLREYFSDFVSDAPTWDMLITAHEAPPSELPHVFTTKEPDPGKNKIKEEFVELAGGRMVRKRLTGMVFVFGGDDSLAIGPCLANANQVINFINNRFISWKLRQGCLLGHAAGVGLYGCGLALAGFSGMGKSTLALHLMSRGTNFISNDRVLLREDSVGLYMYGVAKLPRINPGTALNNPDLAKVIPPHDLEQFAGLSPEALWELEHKYDVFLDHCFGPGRFTLAASMTGLVVLNWQRSQTPTVVREVDIRQRRDLLPAFMKSAGLFFLPEHGEEIDHSEEAYLELLSKTRVYEISGGIDFDRACDACLGILAACRAH
ncbi:MAG: HprK-related kinase B [Desulfurivibrionaceae bacterium]|jgi:HprK-related kinase B